MFHILTAGVILSDGPLVVRPGPSGPIAVYSLIRGEVAERFMAAVLKTVDRKVRGFESLPLRHDSER